MASAGNDERIASARNDGPCPLCGMPLAGEPGVALRGGFAHLACAERQAITAWRRRRRLALLHLALMSLTLITLAAWGWPAPALAALALAWAGMHIQLHRRFWHYTLRDLRQQWRRR